MPAPRTALHLDHLGLAEHGVEIRRGVLSGAEVAALCAAIENCGGALAGAGTRNLDAKLGSVADLAASPRVLALVGAVLAGPPRLVRAILFDKTPERNWLVPWHQDRTVAVRARADLPGWGPWS